MKINVGMLTAQLASYEPELDIFEGYTPDPWDASSCQVLSSSGPGPANFQRAQPDVTPALRT